MDLLQSSETGHQVNQCKMVYSSVSTLKCHILMQEVKFCMP